MASQKLTEPVLKNLPFPVSGQRLIYDSVLTGFGVRVSQGTKSFFAERRLNKKSRRITIGPYPLYSVEKARKAAQVELGKIAEGIDQRAIDSDAKLRSVTLQQAFEEFKGARKTISPRTINDYSTLFTRLLADWLAKPWIAITPAMVLQRHSHIGKANGATTANYAMRAAGSVIRFAMKYYRDKNGNMLTSECPISVLSDTNAWYKEKARATFICPGDFKAWWDAVQNLKNPIARDFFLVLILTGLRKSEAAALTWDRVDLIGRKITILKTKNGDSHVIPISTYLFELLVARRKVAIGAHVFPGVGASEHIVEIKKSVAAVIKASAVSFTCHDLRRTFATYVESLDVSTYAVKKLLNHRSDRDVTFTHYLVIGVERLREPMEKVTAYMLRLVGILPTATVLQLHKSQAASSGQTAL